MIHNRVRSDDGFRNTILVVIITSVEERGSSNFLLCFSNCCVVVLLFEEQRERTSIPSPDQVLFFCRLKVGGLSLFSVQVCVTRVKIPDQSLHRFF